MEYISPLERFVNGLTDLLPTVTALVALAVVGTFIQQYFLSGSPKKEQERIQTEIALEVARGNPPQNTLMREYHTQGLSQSRISFWFSLVFASLGFAIIALSVGLFLQTPPIPSSGWSNVGKPIFTLVAGTVIDAVAALFFVQSNKARQLMTEFFDKLRVDRKLDEALQLMRDIPDPVVASRIKGLAALTFSDVKLDPATIAMVLNSSPKEEKPIRDASGAHPPVQAVV